MQFKTILSVTALALSLAVAGPVCAAEKGIIGSHNLNRSLDQDHAASAYASEKWMTGDFHQHTYYTDGSYPMNDLTAPGMIATHAVADPASLYRKGVMAQGFRFGLDFQANSEHGGIRNRDGFGNAWNAYIPSPVVGDGASPTQTNMWRWQSLIRTSDIPGYTGPSYMGAYDWILGIRTNYPKKLVMTGMEWNPPGHEHSSSGIVAADATPIAEFEYRFDRSDTDGTTTSVTGAAMGWTGKRQNNSYTPPPTTPQFSHSTHSTRRRSTP